MLFLFPLIFNIILTFQFKLKLQVDSYIGPHNSDGLDYITVTVGDSGEVKVEKFEHIKSYKYNYAIKLQ